MVQCAFFFKKATLGAYLCLRSYRSFNEAFNELLIMVNRFRNF